MGLEIKPRELQLRKQARGYSLGQKSWGTPSSFCRKKKRGLRRKVTQKHPRLTYCVLRFFISPWRNGTEEACSYGNSHTAEDNS